MNISHRIALLVTSLALFAASPLVAKESLVKVRLTVDEDPVVPRLAESLGYFQAEGLDVERVDLLKIAPDDYLMQEPLNAEKIDASYHWFNHAIFGARHKFPVTAVMVFNNAPAMTVFVANRVKDEIHSAADFKGRRVAEGAGYGTKAVITSYLAYKAGLPPHSYTPVMLEHEGRQEAVIQGLNRGEVDVMTFQEPITSALAKTGLVSTLYDLNSGESTAKVLGATWPAQSLLMAPRFIKAHPETVQHLVNAFVRAMRFVNSHSADEVIARLPANYFDGKDRAAEIDLIKRTLPSYARGDYSFSRESVDLVVDAMQQSDFDQSEEGKWRGSGDNRLVDAAKLYTNDFVLRAQREFPAAK